jgi:cell shape-determining protein MreC
VLKFRFGAEPGLYLTAVPLTDTVKVGERIVTSATSLLFPAGIPVGRVTMVGKEPTGLLSAIRVEPFAALSRIREVLVAAGPVQADWWPKPAPPDTARRDSVVAAAGVVDSSAAAPPDTARR